MTQIPFPFKFDYRGTPAGRLFVHGVELHRSDDPVKHPFNEFQTPPWYLSTPQDSSTSPQVSWIATDASMEQHRIVTAFRAVYPHIPLDPDRSAHTHVFQEATRKLDAQIGTIAS
jgi:hypothetical protein